VRRRVLRPSVPAHPRALPLTATAPRPARPLFTPPPCSERLSDAEKARGAGLYNTYVKLLWKRQHVMSRDLQRKIKLKWAAIAALPTPELRVEALAVDPFVPLRLRLQTITPPLKGFQREPFRAASASDGDAAAAGAAGPTPVGGPAGGVAAAPAGAAAAAAPPKRQLGGAPADAGVGSALSALRRRTSGSSSGPSLLSSMRAGAAGAGAPPPPALGGGGVPPALGGGKVPGAGVPAAGVPPPAKK
jgi:hypothetical protein